jgi:Dolichyl-phosphate-mannose-protein mannosyltransferase
MVQAAMTINLRSTFLILTLAAAGMGALLAFLPAAGHDQLWGLYVARHVLDGSHLYGPEFMESNPPLIIWLSVVPVALGHLTHIPAPAVGKTLVLLLEALVATVCLRQLRRILPVNAAQVAALAFAFVTLFNVVPARDLGQRDYLLTLLCLPYLLAAVRTAKNLGDKLGSTDPRITSILKYTLIGLAAGLGLALKPHQAILPIAIELYLIYRSRSLRTLLRPEPFAILATAIGYLAAIRHFTPDYLTTLLPILRDTYWAVGSLTFPQLLWQAIELHILAALAFYLHFKWRRYSTPYYLFPIPSLLLTAGTASTLAYYLQGTGWYYQQLPAITFCALALVFELLPLAEERRVPPWTPKAALALAVLALALATHFMNYPFTEARSFAINTPDPTFFENLPPATTVATLTTTVDYTVMPAERYHLTIAQRYPHLWMLPAILRNEQPNSSHPARRIILPEHLAELDHLQHQFMVEDFRRWHPQLVLIERCQKPDIHCQLLEDRDDDLLAWFLRDPAFAAEWKSYTFVGFRGSFDAFTRTTP